MQIIFFIYCKRNVKVDSFALTLCQEYVIFKCPILCLDELIKENLFLKDEEKTITLLSYFHFCTGTGSLAGLAWNMDLLVCIELYYF